MKELYAAIKRRDVATVRRLLTEHAHLKNVETFLNPSWLHDAAALGKGEIVVLLLDLELEVNKIDKPAETSPLISAISNGHVDVVQLLLKRGADPNVGRALISAINLEDATVALQLIRLLVEHGADVNREFLWYEDSKMPRFSPLTWAEASGKTEIADFVLQSAANDNADQQVIPRRTKTGSRKERWSERAALHLQSRVAMIVANWPVQIETEKYWAV